MLKTWPSCATGDVGGVIVCFDDPEGTRDVGLEGGSKRVPL